MFLYACLIYSWRSGVVVGRYCRDQVWDMVSYRHRKKEILIFFSRCGIHNNLASRKIPSYLIHKCNISHSSYRVIPISIIFSCLDFMFIFWLSTIPLNTSSIQEPIVKANKENSLINREFGLNSCFQKGSNF